MSQPTESHHDEYDREGSRLFNEYQINKDNYGLLKEAAAMYENSINPEAKQISLVLLGLYYRELGLHEEDNAKALDDLHNATILIEKACGKDSEEAKRVKLEYLKRKINVYGVGKKPLKELFFERATLYQELNDINNYNVDMSLYYMCSILESQGIGNNLISNAELMVQHAKESGKQELYYKTKVMLHQMKSAVSLNPESAIHEMENALNLIQQTDDRFGEEEAKARLCFTKALITRNKSQRQILLREAANIWNKKGDKKQFVTVMELLAPLPIKVSLILHLADQALKYQHTLSKKVHELLKIEPGTYALFHHHAHLIERIKDVKKIITRLGENRKAITDLSIKENTLRPKKAKPGRPLSKRLQAVMRRHHELIELMKLDMESLYVFGNLMLDQWSYVIAYLTGTRNPDGCNFHVLYDKISGKKDIGRLSPLRDKHSKDIYWLYYQLRSYRNIFIEHVRRPWQRGNTMSVYGTDFNLFIPTPPGWLNEKEIQKSLQSIFRFAPKALQNAPDNYWEKTNLNRVLEVTFMHIDEIEEKTYREKVWSVWKTIGGSTPSYDVVGYRLMEYTVKSVLTLIDIISDNPRIINLGSKESKI